MKNWITRLRHRTKLRRSLAQIRQLDPRLRHDVGLADVTLADLEARLGTGH